MPKGKLHIDLFGLSFTISADEDPRYLEELLRHYKAVCTSVQHSTGLVDPLKISIVSGLMLADELHKSIQARSEDPKAEDNTEAEKITLDLIARIDEVLEEHL